MKRVALLAAGVALTVLVAVQVSIEPGTDSSRFVAEADAPTVAVGADILAGVPEIPSRVRGHDYRRDAFGESWDDDNDAPGGRNGCDTRNDILDRDLIEKSYVSIKRCPTAVATGTLVDPYTDETIAFVRGNQIGASVQIDDGLSVTVTGLGVVCTVQRVDGISSTCDGVCRGRGAI